MVNTYNSTPIVVQSYSGEALLKEVGPNIEDARTKTKKSFRPSLIFFCISVFVAVLGLVLMIVMGTSTPKPGWEHFWDTFGDGPVNFSANWAFFPLILIGAVGAVAFLIRVSKLTLKGSKQKALITIMNEIKGHDKINIADLSINKTHSYIGKSTIFLIIKKLVETGNLGGYEVIGVVGVAKTSCRATERDFMSPAHAAGVIVGDVKKRAAKCTGCGAPISKSSDGFCGYCGSRID